MRNKIIFSLIICMFLFGLVSAVECGNNNIGTFKQGDVISLRQTCDSCTYVNISSVTYPNSTINYLNSAMTKQGVDYNYSFTDSSSLGGYYYSVAGDKDGTLDTETFCFEVTPSGTKSDTGQSIIYFIITIVLIGIDLLMLYFIFSLPSSNERDDDNGMFKIVKLKYLRVVLIGIMYPMIIVTLNLINGLAVNFTSLSIFAGVIGFLFETMLRGSWVYTIVIVIWIFIMLIKDTNFKKLMSRSGYAHG